jgi:hypothetical protein
MRAAIGASPAAVCATLSAVPAEAKRMKVFCFFFSKKKRFLF